MHPKQLSTGCYQNVKIKLLKNPYMLKASEVVGG